MGEPSHLFINKAGEDFAAVRAVVLLPAGESSVTQTVALLDLNAIIPEDGNMFEVYLGPAPGAFVFPIAQANVTILSSSSECHKKVNVRAVATNGVLF